MTPGLGCDHIEEAQNVCDTIGGQGFGLPVSHAEPVSWIVDSLDKVRVEHQHVIRSNAGTPNQGLTLKPQNLEAQVHKTTVLVFDDLRDVEPELLIDLKGVLIGDDDLWRSLVVVAGVVEFLHVRKQVVFDVG